MRADGAPPLRHTVHIVWGEEAARRYRAGIIDNVVRLAHAAYDFFDVREATAFLLGVAAARQEHEWAQVQSLPDLRRLGPPLRQRLMRAIKEGNTREVEELLDLGINPAGTDALGMNALHWAAELGEEHIAEMLIAHGAPLDAPAAGREQATPVMLATKSDRPGAPAVLHLLLARGAKADAHDQHGNTALLQATRDLRVQAAWELLCARADPREKNLLGKSAMDILTLHFEAPRVPTAAAQQLHDWYTAAIARLLATEEARAAQMTRATLRPTPYGNPRATHSPS